MGEKEVTNCLQQTATTKTSLTTFPFSKTTCVCNCGKYDLQELPHLRKILPEDYEYKLCEYLPLDRDDKFLVTLRMTLATPEEALEWKRRFEEKSLTTHVKDKTFPKVERVSIFKAQYRCQFFDRRKSKKKLPEKSKFRDCHSILFMNIKKYFKNTVDQHMPIYQMVVRLHYAHDHPLDTADVLKKRQLNEDIKCWFLEMFRQGMKPKDALDKHKRELLQNLGPEKYRQVICDGYYVPNVPKAYRLYYQIHGKGVSAKTTAKRSSRHNPNPDWIAFQDFSDAVTTDKDKSFNVDDDNSEDNSNEATDDLVSSCAQVEVNHETDTEQHHVQAGMSFQRIYDENIQQDFTSGLSNENSLIVSDTSVSHPVVSKSSENLIADCELSHVDTSQKVTNELITYSNIAVHNMPYTDLRGHNLPAQNVAMSSFSEQHSSMGLFNLMQPPWETLNMAHQQSFLSNVHQHKCQGLQNLGHQHPSANFTMSQNSNCENAKICFIQSEIMIEHRPGHQSSVSETVPSDLNIAGSNLSTDCPWASIRPHSDETILQLHQKDQSHSQEQIRNKTLLSKHLLNHNQRDINSFTKKEINKKRKKRPTKELNMKHVTKRWMDKKPKVEAETQNLASEVLQAIFLKDEAEKLKASLATFLLSLESRMISNPKVFVPAVKQFLQVAEAAKDDLTMVLFLNDFGKTEENIIQTLAAKKVESRETHGTQTRLSGPVFKLGKFKSKTENVVSNIQNAKFHKRHSEPTRGNTKPNMGNGERNWGIAAPNTRKSNIQISDSTVNSSKKSKSVAGCRNFSLHNKGK